MIVLSIPRTTMTVSTRRARRVLTAVITARTTRTTAPMMMTACVSREERPPTLVAEDGHLRGQAEGEEVVHPDADQ